VSIFLFTLNQSLTFLLIFPILYASLFSYTPFETIDRDPYHLEWSDNTPPSVLTEPDVHILLQSKVVALCDLRLLVRHHVLNCGHPIEVQIAPVPARKNRHKQGTSTVLDQDYLQSVLIQGVST
jgi:hypothetical protein